MILWIAATSLASEVQPYQYPSYFYEFEIEHPYCEGHLDLETSGAAFVELENRVDGLKDYNALVRTYHRKDWKALDEGIESFRRVYESSPLREPVHFLGLQSRIDRIEGGLDEKLRPLEKDIREAFLLYPKSYFIPLISGSMGAMWIRFGNANKALGVYESLKQNFPNHSLRCTFELGVGESNFGILNWEPAIRALDYVEKNCKSEVTKLGARLRQADIKVIRRESDAEESLTKVIEAFPNRVARYYPLALSNLGELKYRKRDYKTARFYFNEYMKFERKGAPCVPQSMKRIADIALALKEPKEETIGAYLAVHEAAPNADAGRYSHVKALLLDAKDVSRAEFLRRIRIVDSETEQIQNPDLRENAYREKLMSLVTIGEYESIELFTKLNNHTSKFLDKKELGDYVRERMLGMIVARSSDSLENAAPGASPQELDDAALQPYEQYFDRWLKGTQLEAKARTAYGDAVIRRFKKSISVGDITAAVKKLERWISSPLWSEAGPSMQQKTVVSGTLLRALFRERQEWQTEDTFAMDYLKNEVTLDKIVAGANDLLWGGVAIQTGDEVRIKSLIKKVLPNRDQKREVSAMSQSEEFRDYESFVVGAFLAHEKRVSDAETIFRKISAKELLPRLRQERMEMYRSTKNFLRMYDVVSEGLDQLDKEAKKKRGGELKEIAKEGKLWGKASGLLALATSVELGQKDLSPYLFFSARSKFETGNWKQSIDEYRKAIDNDPTSNEIPEAKYRLGKALFQSKLREQARQEWEELIAMNDSFWSPLAKNEIRTLYGNNKASK